MRSGLQVTPGSHLFSICVIILCVRVGIRQQLNAKSDKGRSKSLEEKNEIIMRDLARFRNLDARQDAAWRFHLDQRKSLRLNNNNLGQQQDEYDACLELDMKLLHHHRPVTAFALPNTLFNLVASVIFEGENKHIFCVREHFSSILDELGSDKDPIRHLLLKCWPKRCWTRKWTEVFIKLRGKYPHIESHINNIVLCCLLGNFDDVRVANRSLDIGVRKQLHELLDQRQGPAYRARVATRTELLRDKDLRRVWIHAIQQYMCWCVRLDIALHRRVNSAMDFDAFEAVIIKANNDIRKHFHGEIDKEALRATINKWRPSILKVFFLSAFFISFL
jgi:hypothetical protein